MADLSPAALAWLTGFAGAAATPGAVDAWVARIDGAILAEIPAMASTPLLVQDLHASSRSHWVNFLEQLPRPTLSVVLDPAVAHLAVSMARQGLDVADLLKVYRVAQTELWSYVTETIAALPPEEPERAELLVPLWSRAADWINVSIERVLAAHAEERERITQGDMARRREIVDGLLSGEPVDTPQASRLLGHALRDHQTAFVLWADSHETVGALADMARRLAHALGSNRPVLVTEGGRDLHCWVATTRVPDLSVLEPLAVELDAHGVSVGVGIPATGVEGFRSSHDQALAVQRLGVLCTRPPRVLRYADVELLTLLSRDVDWSDAFAARALGRLAADDEPTTRIRETLHAVLADNRSLDDAAGHLSVHRNTVRYRLAQADELLGYQASEHRADVALALKWRRLRGPVPRG